VRPYTRVWLEANLSSSRPTRDFVLAVRGGAPFALEFAQERVEVEPGKKAELKLRLRRHAKDFTSAVTVLPQAPPDNLRVAGGEVGADKEEASVAIEVPPGTPAGEYTLAVLCQAQVPYSKDPKAAPKANVLVSLPARPVTVVVRPKP
jgi:hypothetical protein